MKDWAGYLGFASAFAGFISVFMFRAYVVAIVLFGIAAAAGMYVLFG